MTYESCTALPAWPASCDLRFELPSHVDQLPWSGEMTMPELRATVQIVDDDPNFLILVRRLVESVGLNTLLFTSAEHFLREFDSDLPGCLVTDLRMPGMSGLELQSLLARRAAHVPVILISGHADVATAVQAMKLRAVDVLEKPFRNSELLERIQLAVRLDLARRTESAAQDRLSSRLDSLSSREREVMQLVVAGRANKQIALQLDLSIKTVEYHRSRLMRKLEVTTIADLVRFAKAAETPALV